MSQRALLLCGGDEDKSSEDTDEDSDESLDELQEAREKGLAVSGGILRNKVSFSGTHARGSDSLKTSHREDKPQN
jgi:hypothetical protein